MTTPRHRAILSFEIDLTPEPDRGDQLIEALRRTCFDEFGCAVLLSTIAGQEIVSITRGAVRPSLAVLNTDALIDHAL